MNFDSPNTAPTIMALGGLLTVIAGIATNVVMLLRQGRKIDAGTAQSALNTEKLDEHAIAIEDVRLATIGATREAKVISDTVNPP